MCVLRTWSWDKPTKLWMWTSHRSVNKCEIFKLLSKNFTVKKVFHMNKFSSDIFLCLSPQISYFERHSSAKIHSEKCECKKKNFLEFMRRKAPQGAFTTNLHHGCCCRCVYKHTEKTHMMMTNTFHSINFLFSLQRIFHLLLLLFSVTYHVPKIFFLAHFFPWNER